jgi:serine/threonine protein kinase
VSSPGPAVTVFGDEASIDHLENRASKVSLYGRFHKSPRSIEDDYVVTETVLGSGCSGEVKLAKCKDQAVGSKMKTSQAFAVKTYSSLASLGEKDRAFLRSEVEVFLCMDHPHIARLHDVYSSSDSLTLVMECMEGGELFDRVMDTGGFSERYASEAVWQMLLALNYLHEHGVVHRDVKLENFLYDKKGSKHLKLIDFGFSRKWDPSRKLRSTCGTPEYQAPEVSQMSYTSQCDLWSLGVITFILLAGRMPFTGSETAETRNAKLRRAEVLLKRPGRWNISEEAFRFTTSLLEVDPEKRLTASVALNHAWIQRYQGSRRNVGVGTSVVQALRQFGQASKIRRCCLEMMAWSLSNEEHSQVRQAFLAMDAKNNGTITLADLKAVLEEKPEVPDEEARAIFNALDTNRNGEIQYSNFLAAMVGPHIEMHHGLLQDAFKRFDTDRSGSVTVENLSQMLGNTSDGPDAEQLIAEAGILQDGRVSYAGFFLFLTGDRLEGPPAARQQQEFPSAGFITVTDTATESRSCFESMTEARAIAAY